MKLVDYQNWCQLNFGHFLLKETLNLYNQSSCFRFLKKARVVISVPNSMAEFI